MNELDSISVAFANALGVDTSPGQHVSRVELTLRPGETPQLIVTRWVLDRGFVGAVEQALAQPILKPDFGRKS